MFRTLRFRGMRFYHARDHPTSIINKLPESLILDKAIPLLPTYGFTRQCITEAVRQLNYPDSLGSLVKDSALPIHWLKTQRKVLEEHAMAPESPLHNITNEYDRATHLMQTRLLYNEGINLTDLMSQLVLPYNLAESSAELHALSDDIAFYAGDASNDFAWYSKRMGLSTIYVLAEMYQVLNPDRAAVNRFVANKIGDLKKLGLAYNDVEEWALFNGISAFNLIRSQLMRG